MAETPLVQMSDKEAFVGQWLSATAGMSAEQIAAETWKLANWQYAQGFKRGYEDPDFENDDDGKP